ncbi:hypothetical protein PZA11_001459 [Diplocarpon coronariae]|uniref:Uncharacterized protein n=1 Tax=Diplocarpon coronariae TaxID=2795749 RepID=A0A218YZS8_9HELO|nr:hypothetical protein JHW43_000589 [Diplocarpon mali]OWP00982.1 hypothetical protein B2J93_278 [Marssonina coronariae]
MHFNTLSVLTGLLSLAAASVGEALDKRQTPEQTTAAADALMSYISALQTNPAYISVASAIETDAAAVSSLAVFEASVSSVFAQQGTLAADYLDGIPATVRPFFSSVYAAEASILTANGFRNPIPKMTGTSEAAAAKETGMGRMGSMAVAGVVGFVGAVVAL